MPYRAYLTATSPTTAPRRIGPLTAVTSIGRMPACTFTIANDPCVSKLHAEIRQTPEGDFLLEDTKSANGTEVGGRPIQRHLLRHDDRFVIGSVTFHFDLVAEGDDIHSVQVGSSAPMAGPLTIRATPSGVETRSVVLHDGPGGVTDSPGPTVAESAFRPARDIVDPAELRRDYEKLRIAHSTLAEVGRPMPLERTLAIIAQKTFDALPAERFAALLVADRTGALAERLVLERDGSKPNSAVPISRTLLAGVCKDGRPLLSRNVREMPMGETPSLVRASVNSVVCAPAIEGEELFGVLYADNSVRSAPFDEKDLHVLSTIANQLALALRNARLVEEVREEARRRTVLGRFLSPNLVNQVLDGSVSLSRGGESRTVAVLFTDIRGFTALAEKLPAREVTALLNEHFDCLVEVLFRSGGTFDKYIGDSVMAFFGAPKSGPRDAESAVRCALDMQTAIDRLNAARVLRGAPAVDIGIGIAYGEVSWGPIGSRNTMDYTVVGDVVNVASRLCSEAKPGEILVSSAVHEKLPPSMPALKLPKSNVKGRGGNVEIWQVQRG